MIKVTVLPQPPVITYTFPTQLTFNSRRRPSSVRSSRRLEEGAVASRSRSCSARPVPAHGERRDTSCLSTPQRDPCAPNCMVTVSQPGNEIYAPIIDPKPIFIDRATQASRSLRLPATRCSTRRATHPRRWCFGDVSPTASPSGIPVTFNSTTTGICATGGTNGATLSAAGAGSCSVVASVGRDGSTSRQCCLR